LKIGEFQRIIKKLINERSDTIMDLLYDAQTITAELLQEATNAEAILQYIEGAILEIFIIATLLKVDIEKILKETLRRLENKKMRPCAE